jgi:hypothetical protein
MSYFYAVRMIEESDPLTGDVRDRVEEDPESEKWAGSEMEVKANAMRSVNQYPVPRLAPPVLTIKSTVAVIDFHLASPSYDVLFVIA